MALCNVCIRVKKPGEITWGTLSVVSEDFEFTFALNDPSNNNNSISYYSSDIVIPGTKENNYQLSNSYIVNNPENIIGVELDAYVEIDGHDIYNTVGKLTVVDFKHNIASGNIDYTARIISSRYNWIADWADKKLCELVEFFDYTSFSTINAVQSWDHANWGWKKYWVAQPIHYGYWVDADKVTFRDLRPSVYVRYILDVLFKKVFRLNLVSNFINSDYFERLILPYVRDDWGIKQEYRDRNSFLAGWSFDTGCQIQEGEAPYAFFRLGPGNRNKNQIEVFRLRYIYNDSTNGNVDLENNFDTFTGEYRVPASSGDYGGLHICFFSRINYTWRYINGNNCNFSSAHPYRYKPNLCKCNADGGGNYEVDDWGTTTDMVNENFVPDVSVGGQSTTYEPFAKIRFALKKISAIDGLEYYVDVTEWETLNKYNIQYNSLTDHGNWKCACFDPGDRVYVDLEVQWLKSAYYNGSTCIFIQANDFLNSINPDYCKTSYENVTKYISCDLTVKSFLDGLTHMYNLVWDTDMSARTVKVEPHDDYYKLGSIVESWDEYVGCDRNFVYSQVIDNKVCKRRSFKSDSSDGYVKHIEEITAKPLYAQDICITASSGTKIEYIENPAFSPTYYIEDYSVIDGERAERIPIVWPRLWGTYKGIQQLAASSLNNPNINANDFRNLNEVILEKNYKYNPRILYYAGLVSFSDADRTTGWKYEDTVLNEFPYAFMLNPYGNEYEQLTFTDDNFLYSSLKYDFSVGYDRPFNLFLKYWRRWYENSLLSGQAEVTVSKSINDINQLKFDYYKFINNNKWRLDQLTWSPCRTLGQAKLTLASAVKNKYIKLLGNTTDELPLINVGDPSEDFTYNKCAKLVDPDTSLFYTKGNIFGELTNKPYNLRPGLVLEVTMYFYREDGTFVSEVDQVPYFDNMLGPYIYRFDLSGPVDFDTAIPIYDSASNWNIGKNRLGYGSNITNNGTLNIFYTKRDCLDANYYSDGGTEKSALTILIGFNVIYGSHKSPTSYVYIPTLMSTYVGYRTIPSYDPLTNEVSIKIVDRYDNVVIPYGATMYEYGDLTLSASPITGFDPYLLANPLTFNPVTFNTSLEAAFNILGNSTLEDVTMGTSDIFSYNDFYLDMDDDAAKAFMCSYANLYETGWYKDLLSVDSYNFCTYNLSSALKINTIKEVYVENYEYNDFNYAPILNDLIFSLDYESTTYFPSPANPNYVGSDYFNVVSNPATFPSVPVMDENLNKYIAQVPLNITLPALYQLTWNTYFDNEYPNTDLIGGATQSALIFRFFRY